MRKDSRDWVERFCEHALTVPYETKDQWLSNPFALLILFGMGIFTILVDRLVTVWED